MADATELVARIEALGDKLSAAKDSINRRFIGQEKVVDLVLASMLCFGLVVSAPGNVAVLIAAGSSAGSFVAERLKARPSWGMSLKLSALLAAAGFVDIAEMATLGYWGLVTGRKP